MRLDTKLVVHFLLIKYFWLIFCWHVQYSYIMCGITELHTWTVTCRQSSSYMLLTSSHTHIRNLLLQSTTQAAIIFTHSQTDSFLNGLGKGGNKRRKTKWQDVIKCVRKCKKTAKTKHYTFFTKMYENNTQIKDEYYSYSTH